MEEEQKRCDTCRHEKEPWTNGCADCFDYELWEPKDEEERSGDLPPLPRQGEKLNGRRIISVRTDTCGNRK